MDSHYTRWTLAEALTRVSGAERQDDSKLWAMVECGRLLAFGRRHPSSDHEWMEANTCRLLTWRDLKTSTAGGQSDCFTDVLIYPVLHAPNVVDVLDGMLLKHAFWRFVLGDPEVVSLADKAIAVRPELGNVYQMGCWDPHIDNWEWSVIEGLALDCFEGPSEYVKKAAEALMLRHDRLFSLLADEKMDAFGDPLFSYGTYKILPAIWAHMDYFFSVHKGDVHQRNLDEPLKKRSTLRRWSAVMLKRSASVNKFHREHNTIDETRPPIKYRHHLGRKLTVTQASIQEATESMWPNGIPMGLVAKKRDNLIREWQRTNGRKVASSKSIDRYLKN